MTFNSISTAKSKVPPQFRHNFPYFDAVRYCIPGKYMVLLGT